MNTSLRRIPLVLALLGLCAGCGTVGPNNPAGRKLAEAASTRVTVEDVVSTATACRSLATNAGGYVQNAHIDEDAAHLELQVPANQLASVLDQVAALGKETHRTFHAADVTDSSRDLVVELEAKRAARQRLLELLGEIEDERRVLEIESRLVGMQREIDALESRIRKLENTVVYSRLDAELERKRTPGPVTAVFQGVAWLLGQLFELG